MNGQRTEKPEMKILAAVKRDAGEQAALPIQIIREATGAWRAYWNTCYG
jgi:hypothetical protein